MLGCRARCETEETGLAYRGELMGMVATPSEGSRYVASYATNADDETGQAGRPAAPRSPATRPLTRIRAVLGSATSPDLTAALDEALASAEHVAVGAGGNAAAEQLAALTYASAALVALGAEGELDGESVRAAAQVLAETAGIDRAAIDYTLFSNVVTHPTVLELPPLVAAGLQLRLLHDLRVFENVSLWRRSPTGQAECLLQIGHGDVPRRVRAEARTVLRGRKPLGLVGRSTLHSKPVLRFQQVAGAVVGTVGAGERDRAEAFIHQTALALSPVLERELLLDRNREREHALATSGERRLTRLAFDLHDGPIQDILALAADVKHLQQELYPFVLESHRDLAFGRFEDVGARLGELDRALREVSHSLESRSIVSRPLSEILHREVDNFAERSGIEANLELRGDPESLSSAQRITVFRAIQEALANVREHSGATVVDIHVRARRSSIEVRIADNGVGFEVSRSLARAAKRGRLGLVGIGERVRTLGGSFELDSRPGGPTTLSFTLPR